MWSEQYYLSHHVHRQGAYGKLEVRASTIAKTCSNSQCDICQVLVFDDTTFRISEESMILDIENTSGLTSIARKDHTNL